MILVINSLFFSSSGLNPPTLNQKRKRQIQKSIMMPGELLLVLGACSHSLVLQPIRPLTTILNHFRSGILVPGGFGQRGTEGMMLAIKYAREAKIPFLGICLGFQLAVIEWSRNVLNIPGTYHL